MINNFLNSNSTLARFLRTIFQGVVSLLVVAIPTLAGDVDTTTISGAAVALIMAALSAVMGGVSDNTEDDNTEMGYDATNAVYEDVEE